jgi:hypothetical protein
MLALDGSPGHVTEVLSGDYYQPLSTSSPHQIWSAAMVISPLLRGMLGLQTDAIHHSLTLAPHVSGWPWFSVDNLVMGQNKFSLRYEKEMLVVDSRFPEGISLEMERTSGNEECEIEFRPAISPRTKVLKVELNHRPIQFKIESNATDQHVVVHFPAKAGKNILHIWLSRDFEIYTDFSTPPLGSMSRGLRILSEAWSSSRDQVTLEVAGKTGAEYRIKLGQRSDIERVDGAVFDGSKDEWVIQIPANRADPYAHKELAVHFKPANGKH